MHRARMNAATPASSPDPACRVRRLPGRWCLGAAAAVSLSSPAAAAPVAAAQETLHWRVERGDTLVSLQKRLLRSPHRWQDLQRLNGIAEPRRLQVGRMLDVPMAWLRGLPLTARVEQLNGRVTLHRADTGAVELLTVGAAVHTGDLVRTDPRSSASLRLGEGSRLLVRPDSQLVLELSQSLGEGRATTSRVRLDAGSVDTRVPPAAPAVRQRLDVQTPVVNLGVRGTVFRTSAGPEWARVEVLEGLVAAAGQPVAAGQGTRATPAGVEPPQPLLAPPDLQALPGWWPTLQVSWPTVPGATAYRAQVEAADGTLLRDGLFTAPQAAWDAPLPDGDYRVVVRAVDGRGLEGRDVRRAFALRDDPLPVPLMPAPGVRLEGDAVEFDWRPGPPALPPPPGGAAPPPQWRLQVGADADFAALRAERSGVDTVPARLALPPGNHHWRVARVYPDGRVGRWSPSTPFELQRAVAPPPPPPQLLAATVDDGVARLGWTGAADRRTRVQVARDAGFDTAPLLDAVADGDSVAWTAPGPGRYWLRAASVGDDGRAGPFSPPMAFDVDAATKPWWLLAPALLLLLLL